MATHNHEPAQNVMTLTKGNVCKHCGFPIVQNWQGKWITADWKPQRWKFKT